MVSRHLTRPNTNDDPWRTNPVSWWLSRLEQPSPISLLCVRDGHLGHLLLRQKVIVEPNRQAMVPRLLSPPQPDWRTGSGHVISPRPIQQGPARSNSMGPSHSSLSECGVPSIHQLYQPLPPLRPETVHIQASLHSSHVLELLIATLMLLFIRPFITLEVKIQNHRHTITHFPLWKKKKIWDKMHMELRWPISICLCRVRWVKMPIQQHYYLLYQNMWLLLITINQSRGFRIMPSITPHSDDPNVRDHF